MDGEQVLSTESNTRKIQLRKSKCRVDKAGQGFMLVLATGEKMLVAIKTYPSTP